MKGFKKLALASAITAASAGVHADLEVLDDPEMQSVVGQAGLTIDIEAQWEIGEFAYQDAGFLILQGLRMGGNSFGNGTGTAGSYLDNLRLEIDIAGDGTNGDNLLHYGFSQMRDHMQLYVDAANPDTAFASAAAGIDSTRDNLAIDDKRTYDDGDLVIHFDFTDGWASEGGFAAYSADVSDRFLNDDYDTVELMFEHAVDFRFEIDAIGLAASNYDIGSAGLDIDSNHSTGVHEGAPGTTTLISQLGIQGYLGPEDLHIENNGNGFGADGSGVDHDGNGTPDIGTGNADSKIYWSSYFMITDLDMYIDIAGLQISDMAIHNKRGDRSGLDGTSSFDFAHSIREIYAVKDAVIKLGSDAGVNGSNNYDDYVDGIAINTRFKGDIDIGHLSFGDTGDSIGQIFITDMESDTRWIISAN
ncbi:MAG: hypothetical protein C9356_06235 [Oleiphilus sp.]|nr:MAG: hypothetical protein C9356_06235 [Oleiphilus sp.]